MKLRDVWAKISIEGKIMTFRLIWGIIVGTLFWLIDGRIVKLSGGWIESIIGWFLAITLYLVSIPLVWYMFKNTKKTYIIGKGVTLYFGAWLLTWFTLFDLTLPPVPLGNKTISGGP